MMPTILLIEDNSVDAGLVHAALSTELGYHVIWVKTLAEALAELDARRVACALLGLGLPGGVGLELVGALVGAHPEVPIVVLAGREDAALALEAVGGGAQDYLLKSELATGMVGRAVSYAIERAGIRAELARSEARNRLVVDSLGEGLSGYDASGQIQLVAEAAMRGKAAIVDSSGDAIIGQTPDGAVVSWNRGAEQLCGYTAAEVIGRNMGTLAPDAAADELADVVSRVAGSGTVERFDTLLRCKDGGLVDVSLTVSPVYGQGGEVTGFSVIGRDITAGKLAQQALKHQALHDALTGLPNRELLQDRLHQALFRARRHGDRVALLFLDLDDFKLVNDGLGHLAGDELLVQVARRLSRTVRADDTVARFGGDEFILVCEVGTVEAATQMGNRLLKAFEAPFALGRRDVTVTASIGLVMAGRDPTPEGLLQDADTAMYRAKAKGRSRIELFNDSQLESAEERLRIATDLRRALERSELRVFYQPIVSATDARPLAVEALVRWQHPDRGLVPPDEFIPLADETGMIIPIGRWVLREALRERARWQGALPAIPRLRLSVNISARQLSDPTVVDDITAALADADADPDSLILEMTESVLMHDVDALSTLNALRKLGVSLHIDDFGTGHSTLGYLEALPVDILKIDRSFVDGLVTDSDSRSIVTAVIALARTLSLAVVAEGVETESQLGVLRELHCDFAQGFLFARPLPYDELIVWLQGQANHGDRP